MTFPNLVGPIPGKDAWVSISQIDFSDLTYVFTFKPEVGDLAASIGRIGLIHQPLLQEKGESFKVVSGYKRILALKKLDKEGFQAKIAKEEVNELKLFLFTLYENLGTRSLDEVERSTVVAKLINQFGLPHSKVRDEILPLLGLGRSDKVLDLYLALAGMEKEIKEEAVQDRLSLETVKMLAQMAKPERQKVFPWIKGLRLGKNRQKGFLILLWDLAKLKGLSPSAILEDSRVEEIMIRKDWPPPVKAQMVEEYLKGERYPVYKKAKDEYKKAVKELKLPQNFSLNPPPYFEGEEYEIKFKFKDKTDLQQAISYLAHLCKGRALERLLSIP